MKPKKIQLKSRGGLDNKLVQVEGEPLKFKLETDYNYRIGFKNNNIEGCTFIEPAGGPFITVGSEIERHKVKAIYGNGIIEFEL